MTKSAWPLSEKAKHLLFICFAIVRLRIRDCSGRYNGPSHCDKCWVFCALVCVKLRLSQAEVDGCVSVQGLLNSGRAQLGSRLDFSGLHKVYCEHVDCIVVKGHSSACLCVGKQ